MLPYVLPSEQLGRLDPLRIGEVAVSAWPLRSTVIFVCTESGFAPKDKSRLAGKGGVAGMSAERSQTITRYDKVGEW